METPMLILFTISRIGLTARKHLGEIFRIHALMHRVMWITPSYMCHLYWHIDTFVRYMYAWNSRDDLKFI